MKIVLINSCNYGSTGNIMHHIAACARARGHAAYTCVPKTRSNQKNADEHTIFIGGKISKNIHALLGYYTGLNGCFSRWATRRFLKKLNEIKPDVIHLHNLHNCYINLPMLFRYIKAHSIRTIWTLHDCWAFTGQCPHFTLVECSKWADGCSNCPQYTAYPAARLDRTKKMYRLKREWFTGVEDMTVVTPSVWLGELVKRSFLKDYTIQVINNGIDLSVFRPTPSNFREKYHCEDKHLILGVSFGWGFKKGLDVFVELSKKLPEKYQIVLVGTDENTERELPAGVIAIRRTANQKQLAEIYTACDLFVNPTREENYPTVNMEAIACGTPVLTFKTGGSPEIVDVDTGMVTEQNTAQAMELAILSYFSEEPILAQRCANAAVKFDMKSKFQAYTDLYE